jgi:ferric-dicitrate binding protein FerR (iron transport regulator)
VNEARSELGTKQAASVDWTTVDRALFERIATENRVERARWAPRGLRAWQNVSLAIAAGVVAFAVTTRENRSVRGLDTGARGGDEVAGTIQSIDGAGQVRVGGVVAARGVVLRVGDVIEARGAQATIERVGKVTLRLEEGSRATVTRAQGTLVLALAGGAVEAQVVPVATGEAFAVDVGGARIAVHGTHLRVARDGTHVAVDLTEGVVSVGQAPRVGSVLGTLVTAPGHAEFVTTNASETLTVSHDPSEVRAPVALGPGSAVRTSLVTPVFSAATPKTEPTASARTPSPGSGSTHPESRGIAVETPIGVAAEANPEATISNAVRACMAERPRAENVTILVRTTLHLDLGDDGSVRAARFDPPVAPDVNGCAANAIYKVHFAHGGTQAISIDFEFEN